MTPLHSRSPRFGGGGMNFTLGEVGNLNSIKILRAAVRVGTRRSPCLTTNASSSRNSRSESVWSLPGLRSSNARRRVRRECVAHTSTAPGRDGRHRATPARRVWPSPAAAGRAGDGTEGILGGLFRTVPGNEHREDGIFGSPVLEARAQADAGEGVPQVAKVDSFVGGNAREFPDGLAASRLGDGFRAALEGDAEGVREVRPQPMHQLAEELGRLGFVGGLRVAG